MWWTSSCSTIDKSAAVLPFHSSRMVDHFGIVSIHRQRSGSAESAAWGLADDALSRRNETIAAAGAYSICGTSCTAGKSKFAESQSIIAINNASMTITPTKHEMKSSRDELSISDEV